ncbi:hypothetical protein [Vibrio harveyi]|uniref:hypothetical protein n=1 Tax=Vibrio harveyi TaxID=669 RepID=UPI00238000A9|nr:hypothetical protein [Vibrio harveyi]
MISRSPTFVHWNYFLAIEEDLERISRYVDFSGNEDTYSLEIARVLLSACSEIDVVLKLLCKKLNANSSARNINEYQNELNGITTIVPFEVTMPRHQLSTKPWLNWSSGSAPGWWTAHNKVKHQRDTEFAEAKLKHCINAVGALYVAVLHLYQQEAENGDLLQLPKLFNVSNTNFGGTQMGRFGNSFKYKF